MGIFGRFLEDVFGDVFAFFMAEDTGAGGAADPDFFFEEAGEEFSEAGAFEDVLEIIGVAAEAEDDVTRGDALLDVVEIVGLEVEEFDGAAEILGDAVETADEPARVAGFGFDGFVDDDEIDVGAWFFGELFASLDDGFVGEAGRG